MSVHAADPFDLASLPMDALDDGRSVLVSGADEDALATLFARLVAPADDVRGIVVGTDGVDEVVRSTDRLDGRDATDLTVLTESGTAPRAAGTVESVDSIADLTQLGMSLSNSVSEVNQSAGRFRSGVFLCSDICEAVDDIRSVYRFLNTRFLSDLRRHEASRGVCRRHESRRPNRHGQCRELDGVVVRRAPRSPRREPPVDHGSRSRWTPGR